MLLKAAGGVSLKNLNTKEEKVAAIADSFSCEEIIENEGRWNVLVIESSTTQAHQWRLLVRRYAAIIKLTIFMSRR